MKLPTDRKELIKMLLLIGIGVALVGYLSVVGVVKPMRKAKKERLDKISDLRRELGRARKQTDHIEQDAERNYEAVSNILHAAEQKGYVHKATLGNYLLGASDAIERLARGTGVALEPVREIGISDIPHNPARVTDNAFRSYTVTVGASCGLHDLYRFLKEIEESNPYLCISRMTVATRAGTPEKHRVSIEIQWPIWADDDMPDRFREQLKEMEAAAEEEGLQGEEGIREDETGEETPPSGEKEA
jgi:hypothetical protein